MEFDYFADKLKEECGVFGIIADKYLDLSSNCYTGLLMLQHRGQESCGISFWNGEKLQCIKGMGLVSEVFKKDIIKKVKGFTALGHVRYSTYGESNINNAQPLLDEKNQISMAHNGNITNANELKEDLLKKGINFVTTTDSEIILRLILNGDKEDVVKSIKETMTKIKGSYSVLMQIKDKLIGFRDPRGIRPMCIGKLKDSFILASESCSLKAIGAQLVRDVKPGEIVIIDKYGMKSEIFEKNEKQMTCVFEYIYFARHDSIIDKIDVYNFRISSGVELYKENKTDADIVIGVPDSGIPAAIGFSRASGIPYDLGLVKNKYIGRTFIEPHEWKRKKNAALKLNVIESNIKGKRVVVVDDSLVRGTTSRAIVEKLRYAGAREIHFRIASPIIKSPCFLGINMSKHSELLGSDKSIDEIKKSIGADSIGYLSIEGLLKSLNKKEVCLKCFNRAI
ncbi:amidophosphoribosyltransferase [Fervidicella metallireducens]|uniref:amidophosphoribosyltransferase n=1 Tax=Fervidicella metallireducens TaxID=655338 RepID=UPI00055243A0|nr:amidophosphoribosyltransferase [Fervidicella metallireducens]